MSNEHSPDIIEQLTDEDWRALTTFFELLIQADKENQENKNITN